MSDLGTSTLPFCSFSRPGEARRRVGVGIGTELLDLTVAAEQALPDDADLFAAGTLDALLATGPETWERVRAGVAAAVEVAPDRLLSPVSDVALNLPFAVGDFVDFYASRHHARRLGEMFRPGQPALPAAWEHLPIGYHGRSGSVVVSGTPVRRPHGQVAGTDGPTFGPSQRLDLEAEVGFVVGGGSAMGEPILLAEAERHVFGVCLVNDWSARDLQAWEYVPLGPFLGKSFATSVSPWVVPLAALDHVRVPTPAREVALLPHLDDAGLPPGGLDLRLEVRLGDEVVSRPPYASTAWTPAQMLAHLTSGGAPTRPGDLFASGTVSGPGPAEAGSLIELTRGGEEPLTLADGSTRGFLLDGDTVTVSATAAGAWLGEVRGTVVG